MRTHMADESKNEYAAQLQNFNAEQWKHFHVAIPQIFKVTFHSPAVLYFSKSHKVVPFRFHNYYRKGTCVSSVCVCVYTYLHMLSQNLQDMDERRTVKLGETYRSFAEVERKVIPIISKCLEGMVIAAKNVDERKVDKWISPLQNYTQI